jgi:alkylation response protein AidB-like acyl-CoA dehydrogenase
MRLACAYGTCIPENDLSSAHPRPAFVGHALFNFKDKAMDFQLTEEQRRMVASVRDLTQGEFKADAPKYMDGTFPWTNMKKLADIGVLGMSVPEEYGGLGLPVFDTALILEEIAKTCYVTAMATLGEGGMT